MLTPATTPPTPASPHRLNDQQRDLAARNMGLVGLSLSRVLRRYPDVTAHEDDLRSIGYICLCKASRYYDASRGAFSTLAMRILLRELFIAAHKLRRGRFVQIVQDGNSVLDPPDHRTNEPDATANELAVLLGRLPERHREIVEWRFGLGGGAETPCDIIAGRLGVSKQRVSQILSEALAQLRASIA